MATLKLHHFHCIEETSELGSDSPYFAVFIGHPKYNAATSEVKVIRNPKWDNTVDSGDVVTANMVVANNVTSSTLVLVALIEEDWDPDLTGGTFLVLQTWMQAVFQAYGSVGGISLDQLTANVRPEFSKALNACLPNDDCVDIHRLKIPQATGLLPHLAFQGDGGSYSVRFELV